MFAVEMRNDATNGGVPRHLAMSIGFELAHNSDAISKMIKDEQL